ncbi:hypothetical protein HPB48_020856 [Haemaphysalis longicornis]|uniref:Uncharacterized protein n=1 Tax=Haemaphysalis longicornis TaxID=44386 RepID=A0A9J6G0J1_HAELO|nr:hypothetical protein HPB48_020856 [Haemaphysalis longicornis]
MTSKELDAGSEQSHKETIAGSEDCPAAMAAARQRCDRSKEEKVHLEGDQTGYMKFGDDAASCSVGKRARTEVSDEGTEALNTGEPPSKAAPQVRRASLKPKPNIPPDRNKGRPSVT